MSIWSKLSAIAFGLSSTSLILQALMRIEIIPFTWLAWVICSFALALNLALDRSYKR